MMATSLFLPFLSRSVKSIEAAASVLKCRCLPAASVCSKLYPAANHKHSCVNHFHSSYRNYGLEEFFDDPKNYGKYTIKSGMAWSKDLLRRKSTSDLQKLWYLLLKERNMLNTLELHCINTDEPMPGPDRLEKVAESMSNLRDVIDERESALNMLHHGTPDKVAGEWRKNSLGFVYFYKYREHLIPQQLQKIKRGDRPADLAYFHPKLEEWHLRMEERRIKKRTNYYFLIGVKYGQMRAKNPSLPKKMPAWFKKQFKTKWLYGIHPQMPVMMRHIDKDDRWITARPNRY